MKKYVLIISFLIFTTILIGLKPMKVIQNRIVSNNDQPKDTLRIGYTYWWNSSEPIQGVFGNSYALIFSGLVKEIIPHDDGYEEDIIYDSQYGTIEVMEILHHKNLEKAPNGDWSTNKGRRYMTTDCFYNSGLKEGDKVLVFCFEYEGAYVIPGYRCIVKLDSWEDPFHDLITSYVEEGLNKDFILNFKETWIKKGLLYDIDKALESDEKD